MAGTTPTYGLRYPELVDPPDGEALGKNLADDVEAELERIDAAMVTPGTPVELTGSYPYINSTLSRVIELGPLTLVNVNTSYTALGSPGDPIGYLAAELCPPVTIYVDVQVVDGAGERPLRIHVDPDGKIGPQIAVASGAVLRGSFVVPRSIA